MERNRLFLLALFAVTIPVTAIGCSKQQVTGKSVMPDNPSLSPADTRKAMVQWHQQHDHINGSQAQSNNQSATQNTRNNVGD
jgi:hypothetical protein